MLATPYQYSMGLRYSSGPCRLPSPTLTLVLTLPELFADSYPCRHPASTPCRLLPCPRPAGPTMQTPTFVRFHTLNFYQSLYIILYISLKVVHRHGRVESGHLDGKCHLTSPASTRPGAYYTQFSSLILKIFHTFALLSQPS